MLIPLLLAAATVVGPASAAPALAAPADYRQPANWLCRPGRQDACAEGPLPASPPQADCFYVYPTVSLDPTPNSDLLAGVEERGIVAAQLAPFGGVCRLYAPVYRQVTLAALRLSMTGKPAAIDRELPYADVGAAWRDYLAHDNHGRPFVLIGHSQGSNVLSRLLAEEIDGKPIARQLLSAVLPGGTVEVPLTADVGGTFKTLPLCRSEAQTGCILSWASYRDTRPPPPDARFGRSDKPGMTAACTNPAALGGGTAALGAVFGIPWWRGGVAQYRQPADWTDARRSIAMPGLLTGRCRTEGSVAWLSVHVDARASGPAATSTSAAAVGDDAYPDWGWHVVDLAIVQGDLVRLVAAETAAWTARR